MPTELNEPLELLLAHEDGEHTTSWDGCPVCDETIVDWEDEGDGCYSVDFADGGVEVWCL